VPRRSRPSHAGLAAIAPRRSLLLVLIAACSDPTRPEPLDVPPIVFVSTADGSPGLYRLENGAIVRLSATGIDDRDPHSAAGRIVFTSRRDGNPEIYVADLALVSQQRLTTGSSIDDAPALDPAGTTIAFVSTRSGASRVWLMDVTGANPRMLTTGSATFVPEGSPAWSPTGDRILFTSTRTNASQVFVVPVAGGTATQLSHEATGAFTPAWTPDGLGVLYVSLAGGPRVMRVAASGGDAAAFVADEAGVSEPACGSTICLAVTGQLDASGDLIALSVNGRRREPLLVRPADDRQPAVLVP
jgi:TolB protein